MKFSIITPNYNGGAFIERTLHTILKQKGDFEIECIIMDGLSKDNSVEIIKKIAQEVEEGKFAGNCKEIDFIRKSEKDTGQANAFNKWLKLATWDIITYLNSDDTYEENCFATIQKYLSNEKHHRCYGKCKIIDEHDREIRKRVTLYKNLMQKRYSYAKLLSENFISQMTVFWTKAAMQTIGLFDETQHYCMDYEYRLRLGNKYTPRYIDVHLANFRLYQTSKSGSGFKKQFHNELGLAHKYAK